MFLNLLKILNKNAPTREPSMLARFIIGMVDLKYGFTVNFECISFNLSFSAHILYGKRQYLTQTVFLQKLPCSELKFKSKGVIHRIHLT